MTLTLSFIIMYYDLSLLATSLIDLTHLLNTLPDSPIRSVAIDYEYTDVLIPPTPPESFNKLKVLP